MVLQESLLMSKGSLNSKTPQPPSFEEILSDLQSSNCLDVAFQHPGEVCPDVKRLRGHSILANNDKDHAKHEPTSYLPTQNTGITTGDDLSCGQDEEKYKQVTDFLSSYDSLVKSSTILKELGKDLEKDRHELEDKIELVEESWKSLQN